MHPGQNPSTVFRTGKFWFDSEAPWRVFGDLPILWTSRSQKGVNDGDMGVEVNCSKPSADGDA